MSIFEVDQVSLVLNKAEAKIKAERLSWDPVYNLIWSYIDKNNDLLVGGVLGVELLLGLEQSIYLFQVFSPRALLHANVLANELSEVSGRLYGDPYQVIDSLKSGEEIDNFPKPKIVMMKTTLPFQRYAVFMDGRMLIELFTIPSDSVQIIEPIIVDRKDNKIPVISPEIQLLELYRSLYSPASAENWDELRKIEHTLYSYLKNRLPKLKKGALEENIDDLDEIQACNKPKLIGVITKPTVVMHITEAIDEDDEKLGGDHADRQKMQVNIISWCIDKTDVAVIGEHALQILLPDYKAKHSVVQLLAVHPEDVAEKFKKMFSASLSRRPLHIMSDFRLERITVRANDKEIAYIYNAASYDLIPWNIANRGKSILQIANPFVLLRFLLVDFWTVRLFTVSGKIDKNFAQSRLDQIVHSVLSLRSQLSAWDGNNQTGTLGDKFIGLGDSLYRVFQTSDYIGQYESESQAQKNLLRNTKQRFNDYYPEAYKHSNGKYRVFE